MINAPNHTLFGAGHGIGRPRQADSERAADQEAAQAAKLRGAGAIRYWFDNARPGRAPQSHARVAG